MRQLTYTVCLLALALGCRAVPQSTAAARSLSRDDGKIPVTTRSDEARAIYLRGRALNENLQVHDAHVLFEQAVTLDPTFALAEYALAATAPTTRAATEHLRRALALADKASAGERLMILARQARAHGDPEGALQIAETLVAQYPMDERAHWILAGACAAQQKYERAIAEFQAAIALNSKFSLAWNQLGYAYRSAGQTGAAESAFLHYIALVPNDPNPYDSYAELLMKAGRFDESIAQYRKALTIDSHFSGSFVGIAANEMLAGRYDAAVLAAERYFTAARDDGERRTALLTLAMIHVDHGATDPALNAMDRRAALARAGGDTVNMAADGVLIADILLESGRIDAARDRFAQAHALLATSSADAEVKRDDALESRYDAARVALASGDHGTARAQAVAYSVGASARRNDARIRQSHELNGLVALAAREIDASLDELSLADQQNPAVWFAMSRAYAARGDGVRAQALANQARHMNILPTFPYVFTRAALDGATHSATSGNAAETRR
jgi:tetratricopeptide (TPR) repeat protein